MDRKKPFSVAALIDNRVPSSRFLRSLLSLSFFCLILLFFLFPLLFATARPGPAEPLRQVDRNHADEKLLENIIFVTRNDVDDSTKENKTRPYSNETLLILRIQEAISPGSLPAHLWLFSE